MLVTGVTALAVCVVSYLWFGRTSDPELPSHLVGHHNDSRDRICDAYAGLFQMNAEFHNTPPVFYDLFSIPPPPPATASTSDHQAHRGLIVKGIDLKLTPLYHQRNTVKEGSAAWDNIESDIRNWNKVAAVLLNPQMRAIYDTKVLVPKTKGYTMRKALVDLCEEKWARED